MDDESVDRAPAMAVYTPTPGESLPMRMFVRTSGDPYTLVPSVTRIIREMSANQAVERPATLEDIRAEVLHTGAAERVRRLRIRRHRAVDCRGGCRRRAGVRRQRADARVRRPAGDRIDAASTC